MISVKAPHFHLPTPHETSVFLGGSIDMGGAEDWQTRVTEDLSNLDVTIFNPRRDDWDSSWVQDPSRGTKFREQVDWELHYLEQSTFKVFYFADGSASPITLLELGLFGDAKDTVVYCTPNFYRYGNVKVVCETKNILLVESHDKLTSTLRTLMR